MQRELKLTLDPIIKDFKNDLLRNQSFEFEAKELKINELFVVVVVVVAC